MMTTATHRDSSIDILRFLGLTGIILVHNNPPAWLEQLRGFDVPLMVLLSGVVMGMGRQTFDSVRGTTSYLCRRITRLILPTWIFLGIYTLIMYLGLNEYPDWEQIYMRMTLRTHWFVWIIRVFLVTSCSAPLIYLLRQKTPLWLFVMILLAGLIVFEFAHPVMDDSSRYYLLMTIPYIIIFAMGYVLPSLSRRSIGIAIAIAGMIYATWAVVYYHRCGYYVNTNIVKYPPLLYYTSYALMICGLLWLGKDIIDQAMRWPGAGWYRAIVFIGSHTIWIYFWHIIALRFAYLPLRWLAEHGWTTYIPTWLWSFALVYLSATLVTWGQAYLAQRVAKRCPHDTIKKQILAIFAS